MAKKTENTNRVNGANEVKRRTRLSGVVTSDKMANTVVVTVTRTGRHPLYKKTIKHTKKYKAHNTLTAHVGDRVVIEEVRPISKDKRFRVMQVLERSQPQTTLKEEVSDLDLLLGVEKGEEVKENVKDKGETLESSQ